MRQSREITSLGLSILAIIIAFAGFLQGNSLFSIAGVKINVVLAALIAFSFFVERIPKFAFLVLIAGIFIRFRPGIERELLVLMVVAFLAYIAQEKLPGKPFINCILLQVIGTLVFLVIIDVHFISFAPSVVIQETVYNTAIGVLLFLGAEQFIPYGKTKRFTA